GGGERGGFGQLFEYGDGLQFGGQIVQTARLFGEYGGNDVLRMLMQYGLDVNELIQTAFDSFPQGLLNEKTPSETADFMQAR
ncbi:hypothetical protein, partial [Neisseria gonorrhoeae]|uniref:hypothetical protein n=1 Tax=Neisseria gonorrhoeae TaxID=485 RepID=UPI00384BB843